MLKFIYLYKLPITGDQVHREEVWATNQEAANMKWGRIKEMTPEMEDITAKHVQKEENVKFT